MSYREEYNSNSVVIKYMDMTYENWDYSEKYSEIDIAIQYLRYSKPKDNSYLFIAAGSIFNYGRSRESWVKMSDQDEPYTYSIGITVSIGIEYFLKKNASFLIEYGTIFLYSYNRYFNVQSDSPTIRVVKGSIEEHAIQPNQIKFGISMYF